MLTLLTLGRRGALLAAADAIWTRRFGLLFDRQQAQEILGIRSRQAASQLVKRCRLLALPRSDGRLAHPAFQFSPSGRPYEAVAAILEAFAPADLSRYTLAGWFVTPQRLLGGATPAEWLRRGRDPSARSKRRSEAPAASSASSPP